MLCVVHQISGLDVLLGYTDAHGDLLPLTNDDSLHRALASGPPPLRLLVQKRGEDGVQWAISLGQGDRQGRSTRVSPYPGFPDSTFCSLCPWSDLQLVGNS